MFLTGEQYEQIVRQLRSEHPPGRASDRRASPRVGLRAQARLIECKTGGEAPVRSVWVRDISLEGLGFLTSEEIPPGTYLVLSLPTRRKTATLDLLFLTIRCERLGDMQFSIGARFQRIITAEDVR